MSNRTVPGDIKDEDVFLKWGGNHFGAFPINSEIIDNKYTNENGDCKETDNFYPWIAFTDEDGVIGHFIMRYLHGDNKILRFGWVVVDNSIRGKGYGTQMLSKGLEYAFNILGVSIVVPSLRLSTEGIRKSTVNMSIQTLVSKTYSWEIEC